MQSIFFSPINLLFALKIFDIGLIKQSSYLILFSELLVYVFNHTNLSNLRISKLVPLSQKDCDLGEAALCLCLHALDKGRGCVP